MSGIERIKERPRARIGLSSAGLKAYWDQFAGLHDRLTGYNRFVERELSRFGDVYNWQGDDVRGFESPDAVLSGGIMTTGNHPGRARNADELRADMAFAMSPLPGRQRANLHAFYLESGSKKIDRDTEGVPPGSRWIESVKSYEKNVTGKR
ncbi:MAG: L-rhamnose isomerase [Synergistaceae bacterium]|jgi:L-rhamnose isomerase|nr:L-rhamnose isomerase [Synergistaceae bacterium]